MRWIGIWLIVAVSVLAPSAAVAKDYASIARDIVPSGEYGTPPTAATLPEIEQQAQMYNALTQPFNHVSTADVFSDFKPEPLGSGAPGR